MVVKAQRYLFSGSARVGSLALQFLLLTLIARLYGPESTGFYASCFSFASIMAVTMAMGQPARCFRELPVHRADHDEIGFNRISLCSLMAGVISGVLLFAPGVVIGIWVLPDKSLSWIAAAMALTLATLQIGAAIGRSAGSLYWSEFVLNSLWRLLSVVAVSTYVWIYSFHTREQDYLRALTDAWSGTPVLLVMACMLITLTVMVLWLKYATKLRRTHVTLAMMVADWHKDRDSWLIQVLQSVLANVDVLIVASILGAELAGTYFVIARLSSIVALALTVTNPVVVPGISRIAKRGVFEGSQSMLRRNTKVNIVLSLLIVAVLLGAGELLFTRMVGSPMTSQEYLSLFVLLLMQLANNVAGPTVVSSQLFDIRRETIAVIATLVVVGITLMWILGSAYSLPGVAIAVLLVRFPLNLWIVLRIARKSGVNIVTGHVRSAHIGRT